MLTSTKGLRQIYNEFLEARETMMRARNDMNHATHRAVEQLVAMKAFHAFTVKWGEVGRLSRDEIDDCD